ncbi:MAG: hypothetical protein GY810_17205 [Aureispira sp.]|nr:hypothetical protein [Aureispira sp.]
MPHDILDSDFLGGKEEKPREQAEVEKAWWESYLQEGEEVVFYLDVYGKKETPVIKKIKEKSWRKPDPESVGCLSAIVGSILMNIVGLTLTFLSVNLFVVVLATGFVLISVISFSIKYEEKLKKENSYEFKTQISLQPKPPTQQLVLTKRQLILENKRRIFIDDILTTKVEATFLPRLVIELKRARPAYIEMLTVPSAMKLEEVIEKLRFG